MIGDIVSGELDWADVMFLVAAILAAAAAWTARPEHRPAVTFGWAAVCVLAVGFLLL